MLWRLGKSKTVKVMSPSHPLNTWSWAPHTEQRNISDLLVRTMNFLLFTRAFKMLKHNGTKHHLKTFPSHMSSQLFLHNELKRENVFDLFECVDAAMKSSFWRGGFAEGILSFTGFFRLFNLKRKDKGWEKPYLCRDLSRLNSNNGNYWRKKRVCWICSLESSLKFTSLSRVMSQRENWCWRTMIGRVRLREASQAAGAGFQNATCHIWERAVKIKQAQWKSACVRIFQERVRCRQSWRVPRGSSADAKQAAASRPTQSDVYRCGEWIKEAWPRPLTLRLSPSVPPAEVDPPLCVWVMTAAA